MFVYRIIKALAPANLPRTKLMGFLAPIFFRYPPTGVEVQDEKYFFLEKEDDPRPLHLGDVYDHFIDYSRGPYKVLQQ